MRQLSLPLLQTVMLAEIIASVCSATVRDRLASNFGKAIRYSGSLLESSADFVGNCQAGSSTSATVVENGVSTTTAASKAVVRGHR